MKLAYLSPEKRSTVDTITQADIERVRMTPISTFLKVNRGKRALCLFHDDKDPSMWIPEPHRYHCFVCQNSGTTIDIVMKLYNCSFKEVVEKILACG